MAPHTGRLANSCTQACCKRQVLLRVSLPRPHAPLLGMPSSSRTARAHCNPPAAERDAADLTPGRPHPASPASLTAAAQGRVARGVPGCHLRPGPRPTGIKRPSAGGRAGRSADGGRRPTGGPHGRPGCRALLGLAHRLLRAGPGPSCLAPPPLHQPPFHGLARVLDGCA